MVPQNKKEVDTLQRQIGTVARGVRSPIIRENDDLVEIVVDSVLNAAKNHGYEIRNHDVIGVTESILARAQGNYASLDTIAKDVAHKLGTDTVAVIFPILSRNRFASILQGISRAVGKVVLVFKYPSDEVGNPLVDVDLLDKSGINPYQDTLDLPTFRKHFGISTHPFTNMDYVAYYQSIVESENAECEIIFSNQPESALKFTDNILTADIHTYKRTQSILKKAGAQNVWGLADILTSSIDGEGYNEAYGLLGANKASEETIKLFPRDGETFVHDVQKVIFDRTDKQVEVLVYGDGAFKDPVGKIWELADPTVAPYYTVGLEGTPNEIKLKYLADNQGKDMNPSDLRAYVKSEIDNKSNNDDQDKRLGTTPRRLTDLIGSLCDLTSGSGDKGTPIVHIQGYFDSYVDE